MSTFSGIGLGFVHNGNGKVGQAIIWATTPLRHLLSSKKRYETPSHVFIWFEYKDGRRVYFEALEGHGWLGPKEISSVDDWVAECPEKRWQEQISLLPWYSETQIQEAYNFCERMKDYWTYKTNQLPLLLRTVAPIANAIVASSPNGVICSEAASRVLHNDFLDFREICGVKQHDYINPRMLYEGCKYITKRTT